MSWLECHYTEHYALTFHTPNESRGTQMHYAMRAKEGVKSGVPDIIHMGGTDKWRSGLFELKRCDSTKSKVSQKQREFLENADARGSFCCVCYGSEQFKLAWLDYLA